MAAAAALSCVCIGRAEWKQESRPSSSYFQFFGLPPSFPSESFSSPPRAMVERGPRFHFGPPPSPEVVMMVAPLP